MRISAVQKSVVKLVRMTSEVDMVRLKTGCHNLIISAVCAGRGARRAAGAHQAVGARARPPRTSAARARPSETLRCPRSTQATNDPW